MVFNLLLQSNIGTTGEVSKGDTKPAAVRLKSAASDVSVTTKSDVYQPEGSSLSDQHPFRPVDQSAVVPPLNSQPA